MTTNKNIAQIKRSSKLLPNRRLPIGKNFFPQRTLRLCGEILKKIFSLRAWCLGAKNLVNVSYYFAVFPLPFMRE